MYNVDNLAYSRGLGVILASYFASVRVFQEELLNFDVQRAILIFLNYLVVCLRQLLDA